MKILNILYKKKDNHTHFFLILTLLVSVMILFRGNPKISMWIGFLLAGYSSIANDSIQTLGTFISSNKKTVWWKLWLYLGGILVIVMTIGWIGNNGDISFGRLSRIPEATEISIIQLSAPVILLILTHFRIPISTTFLLLSVFSSSKTISAMLTKTAAGYLLAFVVAIIVWAIVAELVNKNKFFRKKYNKKIWRLFQWISTGALWTTWLMQDTANVAVFLPRNISLEAFFIVVSFLFILLGFLMYLKGGRIQRVIQEKTDVVDVRPATIIDFVYAVLLFFFKGINNIPMSTTWVFLGLLAGREFSLSRLSKHPKRYKHTLKLVTKDISLAGIGLITSLGLAWLAQQGY